VVEEGERPHHPPAVERQHPADLETAEILAALVDDEVDHGEAPSDGALV
jgi:hypothetical protein